LLPDNTVAGALFVGTRETPGGGGGGVGLGVIVTITEFDLENMVGTLLAEAVNLLLIVEGFTAVAGILIE